MFMSWYVILHTQGGSSVTNHASLNASEVRLAYLTGAFIENYVLHSENPLLKCLTIFSV